MRYVKRDDSAKMMILSRMDWDSGLDLFPIPIKQSGRADMGIAIVIRARFTMEWGVNTGTTARGEGIEACMQC